MREALQVAVTESRKPELRRRSRLLFDAAVESPPPPAPLPRLGAAARIREALGRWLEEDM